MLLKEEWKEFIAAFLAALFLFYNLASGEESAG